MGRVTVNREAVHEAYRRDVVPDWQDRTGELMEAAIGASMPFQTGFMRIGLDTQPITHPDGSPGVRAKGRADYTVFVDQGTGLYGPLKRLIVPKSPTTKALSWIGAKGRVFAKSTKGQRGQKFFVRGLRAVFDRVEDHPL